MYTERKRRSLRALKPSKPPFHANTDTVAQTMHLQSCIKSLRLCNHKEHCILCHTPLYEAICWTWIKKQRPQRDRTPLQCENVGQCYDDAELNTLHNRSKPQAKVHLCKQQAFFFFPSLHMQDV